mgnify:CR=1 FL=1
MLPLGRANWGLFSMDVQNLWKVMDLLSKTNLTAVMLLYWRRKRASKRLSIDWRTYPPTQKSRWELKETLAISTAETDQHNTRVPSFTHLNPALTAAHQPKRVDSRQLWKLIVTTVSTSSVYSTAGRQFWRSTNSEVLLYLPWTTRRRI